MKKNKKKILGIVCLFLIAVMTLIAYTLPSPDASATSVTEHVSIEVHQPYPIVDLVSPENGFRTTDSSVVVHFEYSDCNHIDFVLYYTDKDGNPHYSNLGTYRPSGISEPKSGDDAEIASGEDDFYISLDNFGYGSYQLTATPIGHGTNTEDNLVFEYLPLYIENTTNDGKNDIVNSADFSENGDPNIAVFYDDENVATYLVEVYNKTTQLVYGPKVFAITSQSLNPDWHELFFENEEIPTGEYVVSVSAMNANGDQLHESYTALINYTKPASPEEEPDDDDDGDDEPTIPNTSADIDAPDTGMFFGLIDTTKTDFLVTLLIIFSLACASSLVLIVRRRAGIVVTSNKRTRKPKSKK